MGSVGAGVGSVGAGKGDENGVCGVSGGRTPASAGGFGVAGASVGRAAASAGGFGVGGGVGAGENAKGWGRSACAGGSGAGVSFGRTGAVGTCVRFSAVMAASGIRPSGSGGLGAASCLGGSCLGGGGFGSGGFGCSMVTSIASSAGGKDGRLSIVHHNAAATAACNSTASAKAEGDRWSER